LWRAFASVYLDAIEAAVEIEKLSPFFLNGKSVIFFLMPIKNKIVVRIKKLNLKKLKRFNKRRFFKTAFFIFLFFSFIVCGAVLGFYKAILQNLPDISQLEEWEPSKVTYIYSDEQEVVGEYALEKRVEASFDQIPEILKNAIIATEDPRFYEHKGIDFRGILRAIKEDIKLVFTPGKLHGGSTISQQLITRLMLHRGQTLRRKLKEAILALQLERKYSKEQILTLYCNQFYLGHGAYGVETAAELYFGKSVSELSLSEAALITGIFRGPGVYSPYENPEGTLRRRNHVLNRMKEEGYITGEECESAKKEEMNVLPLHRMNSDFAAYFKEEIRKHLEENYGADALYTQGLKVYSTLNPTFQEYAEEALKKQLRILDKRQGWRKDKVNLIEKGVEDLEGIEERLFVRIENKESREEYLSSWLKTDLEEADLLEAVVLEVERNEAKVKVKEYTGTLTNRNIGWTKTNNLQNLIKRGDIILVKIEKIDEEKKEFEASLDQEPKLEGAVLAIEPQTGEIKAMVGGYSFHRSKWNNATQAMRQAGSVIKPMLYTAALENGFTPADRIVDEPTDFIDKWSGETWSPPNYDGKYKGSVTVRQGLEESRNIVTAKLLEYISPQIGVEYCQKFGITAPIYPYLSLALGAFEVKMIELVSAFTTFPNKGIRITPYYISRIEDKDGNILEEAKIESQEVISPQMAFIVTNMLRGVVQRGTAWRAGSLENNLCGKTGTTDDWADAWFIGFSPSLVVGVWIGHRTERISIGERQSGAVAALPVFIDFFDKLIKDKKKKAEQAGVEYKWEEFEVPPHLVQKTIDRKTGLLATYICLFPINEYFLPGKVPDRFCSYDDHMLTYDYYEILKKEEE
jgi:penicillin-binding protein 1A